MKIRAALLPAHTRPPFPDASWGCGQAAGAWDHIQHGYSLEAKVLLSNLLMEVPEAFFNLSRWQKTLASWFRGILLCVAGLCSITWHPAPSASKEMNLPFNGGAMGEKRMRHRKYLPRIACEAFSWFFWHLVHILTPFLWETFPPYESALQGPIAIGRTGPCSTFIYYETLLQ